MANQETQVLDDIIVSSRRKMLTLGATSLAGMFLGASPRKAEAQAAATYTDADILNFALNLEYLEANFYYLSAFGTTIDVPNAATMAAGAPLIVLDGAVGTPGLVTGGPGGGKPIAFTSVRIGAYATETAVEEGKHVQFLKGALGAMAVAQPAINLGTSFQALGSNLVPAAPSFTPYDNDEDFLVGAYIFEDVGVTAYHGAAKLITTPAYLAAAAGILAVEAYHAGLVRATINDLDPTGNGLASFTNSISALRATLSQQALLAPQTQPFLDTTPDDFGLAGFPVTLASGNVDASRIADADQPNVIAFARNTAQVLNIVTGGGAVSGTTVVKPATGIFFPNGMNAGPNGFR